MAVATFEKKEKGRGSGKGVWGKGRGEIWIWAPPFPLPPRVSYGTSEFMESRKGGREKSKGSLSASKMKERQKENVCMANLLPVPPTCIGKRENLLLERERERD